LWRSVEDLDCRRCDLPAWKAGPFARSRNL